MKKLLAIILMCYAFNAPAQVNHLVISQVYGGGGNTGALYKYDFVELYNPTPNPISLAGWSLQYAGAKTNNWNSNKVNLSGTVASGKYFLIQLGNPGSEGGALPTPDLSGTGTSNNISISTTAGKVALVNNTTLLTGNCPLPNVAVVDFVGFGNADCFETAAATGPVSGNTTSSINRLNNGCTDGDNNSADFVLMTVSPRNSASSGHTCNGNTISITAVMPTLFCVDANASSAGIASYSATGAFNNSTFNIVLSNANSSFSFPVTIGSVTLSGIDPSGTININIPAGTPSGTGYKIRVEATNPALIGTPGSAFEIINGAKNILQNEFYTAPNNTFITLNWTNPAGCYDEILIVAKESAAINGVPAGDGSAYVADSNFLGSGSPFDGGKVVYKGTGTRKTITNLTNGTTYFFKAFTRRGTAWSSGTEISDKPRVVPLPGEIVINQLSPRYNTATDEYIELINLSSKAFNLADVAIDVKDKNGTHVVAGAGLTGAIQPYSYWLILPLAKDTITVGQTIGLMANNKIDLGFADTSNQVALIRKADSIVIDAVGYGTIKKPTYTEGVPIANPPLKDGLKRVMAGSDNNNNATDFTTVANAIIDLRNSNSRLANANANILSGNYTVLEVTGNSTLAGSVTLSEKAILTAGILNVVDYNLTTPKVTGSTATKYVKTSGTGTLAITNINTTDVVFPVGNSTYNPITISNGSNLTWSVNVADAIAGATPFEKTYAVQRTWNITPSSVPASGATLVFEYDDNDAAQLGSHFDKTKQVQLWQYHNNIWQQVGAPQMPAATASGRKAVTATNHTRFSPFAIVGIDAPLPVHFTTFSAWVQNGGVQLQFTNPSEENVRHYKIERAADGQLFQNLMVLTPQKNDGSTVTYKWFDAHPITGDAWYRVTGIDEDGTMQQTPVLKINTARIIKALTVYPNPVQARVIIWQATLPKGKYNLQISNNAGQQVMQQTFDYNGGTRTETLALPAGVQAGVYLLQIGSGAFVRQQTFMLL